MPKETFRWNLKFKEFLPIHPFLSTCCHCPANRHHPHPCDRATRERESTRSRTLQRTPSAPAPSKVATAQQTGTIRTHATGQQERERAHGHERFRELHQLQLHPKAKKGSKNRIQLQTSPQNSSERHCKPLEGIDCAGLTVWERSVLMQSQVRSVHEAFTYAPNQIVRSHTACRSRSDKHLRASRCCPLQKQLFETKVIFWIRGIRLKNFTVYKFVQDQAA